MLRLLERGASPNAVRVTVDFPMSGKSVFSSAPPVVAAAVAKDSAKVSLLREHGAELNTWSQDKDSATPLMIATCRNDRRSVDALLRPGEHRADPNFGRFNGSYSALDLALKNGYSELAGDLMIAGATPTLGVVPCKRGDLEYVCTRYPLLERTNGCFLLSREWTRECRAPEDYCLGLMANSVPLWMRSKAFWWRDR